MLSRRRLTQPAAALAGAIMVVRHPNATVLPGQLALELFNKHAGPGLSGCVTPRTVGFPGPNRAKLLQRAALFDHLADCLETGAQPQKDV
jgi:hypothetical protein